MKKTSSPFIKNIAVVIVTALLFFVVTMPFRRFFQVMAVTEVRPAGAFNPLFGLLFGFSGALGCAVGNLAADVISGYSGEMLILGFLVQMVYGLVPRIIWKHFNWQIRLNTSDNIVRYMSVMLGDSLLTALLLGICMSVTQIGSVFSMTTLMLLLNNFVFCMVLGIPILLFYTKRTMKKNGEKFSLNERFILIFLSLAILSAAMIGLIAYGELAPDSDSLLDLWNRIYIYISINLFVFCAAIIGFVRYTERNITIPLEKLADAAWQYTHTGENGRLATHQVISECEKYMQIHGEVGTLSGAFRDMAGSLDKYIDNLTKITAEKERIGAELNIATQIQEDMLPNIFPAFPERKEFEIFAVMNPAKEVGGDFYDFFLIDDNHLALVIADVSGKGIPAALFMVISKTLIKNQALMGLCPKDILTKVNDQLCENNHAQMFVTVWLGILDITSGKLTAANAGHEYPAIRKANGEFNLYKDKHGFVLAGMEHMKYREYELQLEYGDTLFVYTDGVPEATDSNNSLYKTERMIAALNKAQAAQPEELIKYVRQDIDSFVGNAVQFDDITMLAMTYYGSQKQEKTITVSALKENWNTVSDFLEKELEENNASLKSKLQLLTAAEELYVNIANYAYIEKAGEVKIQIDILQNPKRARITLIDGGIPYNPLEQSVPDITLSAEERKIGGLGIHMVRKSMDSVEYRYADKCNIIAIEKALQ